METIIIILFIFWAALEITIRFVFGSYKYHRDKFLKSIKGGYRLNYFSKNMICTDTGYISPTPGSIIFSYYIEYKGHNYLVPRWSATHKDIKALFNQLKEEL